MRKLLFFWFLLWANGKLNSQNLNVAHHSFIDEASHLISINTRHFYIETILSESFGSSTNMVALDAQGNTIFKVDISFGESTRPTNFIKTFDNCLLIAGVSSGCDFDDGPHNFILKIDTNGATKFLVTSPPDGNYWPGYFSYFIQSRDSSYFILGDTLMFHYSKAGQFISTIKTGLIDGFSIAEMNNGNFFINGFDTSFLYKSIEISPGGSEVSRQISNGYAYLVSHPSSGMFYGLREGTIEKINSSLLAIANSTNSVNPDLIISSFIIKNDSIYFTGVMQSDGTPAYGILNLNLTLLHISQSTYKKIYPSAITINNQNKIGIIANANSVSSFAFSMGFHSSFTTFYQFPLTGNFSAGADIGVESFSLASAGKIANQGNLLLNFNVSVKNYSNDTIKNFCLSSGAVQLICGFSLFHKYYATTIPPNSSIVVETGTMNSWILSPISHTSTEYVFDQDICIFTTVPNQQSDEDINNDGMCSRVLFSDTIVKKSVSAPLISAPNVITGLSVFPNPFVESIKIESEAEIEKISLTSVIGQIIAEVPVNNKIYSLENLGLSAGIYFLKIKTVEATQIKKVIKN